MKICAIDVGLTTGIGAAEVKKAEFIDFKFIDCFVTYKDLELAEVRKGRFIRFAKRHDFDEYIVEWPKRDPRFGASDLLEAEVQLWESIFTHEVFEGKLSVVTPGIWKTSIAGIWNPNDILPVERQFGKAFALSKHELDTLRIIYWRAKRLKINE